jgi:hypothetical protein
MVKHLGRLLVAPQKEFLNNRLGFYLPNLLFTEAEPPPDEKRIRCIASMEPRYFIGEYVS